MENEALRAVLSSWLDAIRVRSHVFENFLQFVDSRCRQGFGSSEQRERENVMAFR